MKIVINRFEGYQTNRVGLCLLVGTKNSVENILLRQRCKLIIDEEQVFCTIIDIRKNSASSSIKLQLDNNLRNIKIINPYVYRNDLSFSLYIYEKVERSIYTEANQLLKQLSIKTGKDVSDLLCEMTRFNNYPGQRDLNFVSQKQMLVLIDKIKKELSGGS